MIPAVFGPLWAEVLSPWIHPGECLSGVNLLVRLGHGIFVPHGSECPTIPPETAPAWAQDLGPPGRRLVLNIPGIEVLPIGGHGHALQGRR